MVQHLRWSRSPSQNVLASLLQLGHAGRCISFVNRHWKPINSLYVEPFTEYCRTEAACGQIATADNVCEIINTQFRASLDSPSIGNTTRTRIQNLRDNCSSHRPVHCWQTEARSSTFFLLRLANVRAQLLQPGHSVCPTPLDLCTYHINADWLSVSRDGQRSTCQ